GRGRRDGVVGQPAGVDGGPGPVHAGDRALPGGRGAGDIAGSGGRAHAGAGLPRPGGAAGVQRRGGAAGGKGSGGVSARNGKVINNHVVAVIENEWAQMRRNRVVIFTTFAPPFLFVALALTVLYLASWIEVNQALVEKVTKSVSEGLGSGLDTSA